MLKPQKTAKAQMKIQFCVFLWITFLNIIVQVCQPQLQALHFHSWAFFMGNIMFFITLDGDIKMRYIQVLTGSITGIILAAAMLIAIVALEHFGLPYIIAVAIPVSISLAFLIMLKPVFPMLFNNYGFAYLMIAMISPKEAVANMPYYLICTVLGHIIATGGSLLIIVLVSRRLGFKIGQAKPEE